MSATETSRNVLFLCTGNTARSLLAEAALNRLGRGRFSAYSAGSFPKGEVHPLTVRLLKQRGYTTDGLRSKSWDEFAAPGAPRMSFVITVCDNAANEVCPIWPGTPLKAHWGLPDPAAAKGTEADREMAFAETHQVLTERIGAMLDLPFDAMDTTTLRRALDAIGRGDGFAVKVAR